MESSRSDCAPKRKYYLMVQMLQRTSGELETPCGHRLAKLPTQCSVSFLPIQQNQSEGMPSACSASALEFVLLRSTSPWAQLKTQRQFKERVSCSYILSFLCFILPSYNLWIIICQLFYFLLGMVCLKAAWSSSGLPVCMKYHWQLPVFGQSVDPASIEMVIKTLFSS